MILISSDEFILPELGKRLGAYAQPKLAARGVEINACTRVTAVGDGMVELSNGQKILATTLIWTAGNAPNPLVATLPIPKNSGRILVDEYLAAKEFPGVSALGACASIPDRKNVAFHPRTAKHAIREARCAARNVAADIVGGSKGPIRFSTLGRLAAIGLEPGWRTSSASTSRGFLHGGCGVRSICSSFHGSRRRCALLSIGRSISVLQRISHV
jgi:NADH:ubiquinone reductase (H+-translocating)